MRVAHEHVHIRGHEPRTLHLNPHHEAYGDYGGRGITLCERWMRVADFLHDVGTRPGPEYTLESISNDGHYEPGNVRWATRAEQNRNSRKNIRLPLNGETHTLSKWARMAGRHPDLVGERIRRYGWSLERALTEPPMPHQEIIRLAHLAKGIKRTQQSSEGGASC